MEFEGNTGKPCLQKQSNCVGDGGGCGKQKKWLETQFGGLDLLDLVLV
jgi:hypothetical protein